MTPMDYDALKFWLQILQLIGIVIIGIYTWWQSRTRATTGAIDRVEQHAAEQRALVNARVDEHNSRLTRIEERFDHIPGQRDLSAICDRLGVTDRNLAEVTAEVRATNHLLTVVHTHLLNRADAP